MLSDAYWWADLIRLVMGTGALWLAALVVRLGMRKDDRGGHPSLLTYLSYAGCLVLLAALRISHIGESPTWDLWVSLTIVVIGFVGVMKRTEFDLRPPHRR